MNYFVTENEFYSELFQRLLSDEVASQTEFRIGSNRYDAESLARSYAISKQRPIVLLLDARSRYEEDAREEQQQVRSMLRQHSIDRSDAFVVYPSVVEVLFSNERFRESLREKGASKPLFFRHSPSQRPSFHNLEWQSILSTLDEQEIRLLRENKLVRNVESFLGAQEEGGVRVKGPSAFIDRIHEAIEDRLERKGLRFAGIVVDVQRPQHHSEEWAALDLKLAERVAHDDVRPILEYALRKIISSGDFAEDILSEVSFFSIGREEAAL